MKKINVINTIKSSGKTIYEYENTMKMRKPMSTRAGGPMMNKKDKKSLKRPKITLSHYEKF